MKASLAALAAMSTTILTAIPAFAQEDAQPLEAQVMTADGQEAGTVTFRQAEHGVVVTAQLRNLPEGPHGFHVHETGACEPDFTAAGGHYNPAGAEHGFDTAEGHHAGDLPNIHVAADGTAAAEVFAPQFTLSSGGGDGAPFALNDEDGSAIMVHAQADDYVSADSAGDRIACGVIAAGS